MRRIAYATLLTLLVAPVVTGCSDAPAETARPVVGECRLYDAEAANAAVESSTPVSCAESHSAETFAVVDVLPDPDDGDTWSDEVVVRAAKSACGPDAHAKWLGVTAIELGATRLSQTYFVPPAGDVEAGARWIRCDSVAFADTEPTVLTASQRKSADVAGAFARCTKEPPSSQFESTVCREGGTGYAAVEAIDLGSPGNSYPGAAALLKVVEPECRAVAEKASGGQSDSDWSATGPTAEAWNDGVRYGLCWLKLDQWEIDAAAWPAESTPGSGVQV